ncbi:MAG: hypothetical protein AVDCRST_MAG36-1111 [uncultured Nocardioidaceae bacterium]|uniref:Uncharacterized protein n=1 Tax=uncultured Nocardioidaceae bacterium TaxID=253824 RepID=A0A6J4LKZ4_9ACTN|nr:MAG: hypothetical protein AVDCRST_MAG36-1111 [uncultured Nocardioidaceae bacterium]
MITAAMITMFWLGTASGVMGAVLLRIPSTAEAAEPLAVTEAGTQAVTASVASGAGALRRAA